MVTKSLHRNCLIMNKVIFKNLILLVCAILMACQGGKSNTPSNRTEPKGDVRQTTKVRDISLYLYDDFPVQKAQMLVDALKEAYPSVSLQKESLVLPKEWLSRKKVWVNKKILSLLLWKQRY